MSSILAGDEFIVGIEVIMEEGLVAPASALYCRMRLEPLHEVRG
jgi:hypothetical protein